MAPKVILPPRFFQGLSKCIDENAHLRVKRFDIAIVAVSRVRALIAAGANIHYKRDEKYDAIIDAVHGPDEPLLEMLKRQERSTSIGLWR